MPDEAVVAEPSTAVVENAVVENHATPGKLTAAVRDAWNQGKPAVESERPTKAEGAKPSDTGKDPASAAAEKPEAEAGKPVQEPKPAQNSETRLNHLLANLRRAGLKPSEINKLGAEEIRAAIRKLEEPEPVRQETAPIMDAELKPPVKPKLEDFDTMEKYETARDKYADDLSDYKVKKGIAEYEATQRQEAAKREMSERLKVARERYPDADEHIFPTNEAILSDPKIPGAVKQMVADSEVFIDLLYALGSDAAEFDKFLALARNEPGKALRYVALTESLVLDELDKTKGGGKEKAAPAEKEKVPAKPETRAPKPVSEVGGRGASPEDALDSAVQAAHGKLTPQVKAEMNRRHLARLKA